MATSLMLFHPQTSSYLLSQLFATHLGVALLFLHNSLSASLLYISASFLVQTFNNMCPVATKWVLMTVMAVLTFSCQIKDKSFPHKITKTVWRSDHFLTKLWLFECRCPSKCNSEKTSFKVKEQNSKNYHKNKENERLHECFATCGCQICTETF